MKHGEEPQGAIRIREGRKMLDLARQERLRGCLESAQELYHQAMANSPRDPDAYYGLGLVALECEAPSLARNYFRMAEELGMSYPRDGQRGETDPSS